MAPWIACFVLAFIPLGEAVRPKWTDALDNEPNDDRAQCLRQDNLDIAGGETSQKYILRQVYSPDHANPQTDIYILCEDFVLRRIHALLTIQRVEKNEFEFTLAGPTYDKFRAAGEISQHKPDVGNSALELAVVLWGGGLGGHVQTSLTKYTSTSRESWKFQPGFTSHTILTCLP